MLDAFPTPMFGRSAERARLLDLMTDPSIQVVSLTGRSGVGKTRLAVDVIRALIADTGTPVVSVALAGIEDPDLVLPEIAAALGLPPLPRVEVDTALRERLRDDEVVLLLDNFEHVLGAASALARILDQCPGVRALVTSQAPLRLRHERVVRLAPLPIPPPDVVDLTTLREEPTVAIYCERAAAVDQSFALTATNAHAIAELCGRLEGLPLAIELAAARAATLPAAEIIARLEAGALDLVRMPAPDVPRRHHDLRAAIAWTYDLLGETEQRLLRVLSVVGHSFDIDTAEMLLDARLGDVVDALGVLVDFHLVDPIPGTEPARFGLPSSIRSFAAQLLDESGERDAIRRRSVVWRADRAAAAAANADLLPSARVLVEEELLHALADALELGLVGAALDLVCELGPLFMARGYYAGHERLVEEAISLASADGHTSAYVNGLLWSALLGAMHSTTCAPAVYLDRLHAAEKLARDLDDDDALLRALAFWLRVLPVSQDDEKARRAADEGLVLAAHLGNHRWLARFQAWSGMVAHQAGDDERAVQLGIEALRRARAVGDGRTIVAATMLLRPLAAKHPDIAADVPEYSVALEHARAAGMFLVEAALLPMLAVDASDRGDKSAAQAWCREALTYARSVAERPHAGYALIAAAVLAAADGDDKSVANLHGMVRERLPLLERNMPPEHVALYAAVVDRARTTLGTEAFDAAVERGALVSWRDGIDAMLRCLPSASDDATPPPVAEPGQPSLTARQLQVLQLLADGLSNKEIAARLHVSPKTVMHHALGIFRTLGVRSRSEATAWAFRAGVVR